MSYRVAVIGAGASGLTAVKCCLDEGLKPVCFEQRDYIGGLWHFTEKVGDGRAPVTRYTITNTSKEMMAYSDFPPPKQYPPYLSHWLQDEYLNLYADHFDLKQYIRLKNEVVSVEEAKDHAVSGQWLVTVKDKDTGKVASHSVNAVMLCTGPFTKPFMPTFDGTQEFKGRIIHSYEYSDPSDYDGKTVVVVGFGNTALDIAVELSRTAKQVYLSTRSGAWLFNRVGKGGMPLDMTNNRIAGFFMSHWLSFVDRVLEKQCLQKLDHQRYGLCPDNSPTKCNTIVNDELPACLIQGSIKITKGVSYLKGNTVEIIDGRSVDNVDVIIMATGYRTFFPFLDKRIFGDDVTNLYKAIFPPDRQLPTLAVIGCYRLTGPFPPCAEMQSRVATRVFKGLVKLPSEERMVKEIERRKHHAATKRVASKSFNIQLDWIPYMNELAPMIGVKPNIFWLLITDWRLAIQCMFGACTPYQFRLMGPGAWKGAREALMTQIARTFYSLDHGTGRVTKKKNGVLGRVMLWSLLVYAIYRGYQRRNSVISLLQKHIPYFLR